MTNNCRDVFGAQQANNITGNWILPLNECKCFSSQGTVIGRCPRSQPRVIPEWPLASVCGGDGVTYDTAADACAHKTFPLHGGFCGACSTRHDIDLYNSTRNNLTATTTACALQLLYHGYIVLHAEFHDMTHCRYAAGMACMDNRVGLSHACTMCWVDNMACDAATCKSDCLLAKLTRQPPVDKNGHLNAYVLDVFSSPPSHRAPALTCLQLPRVRRRLLRGPVHSLCRRQSSAQRHTQV